MIYRVTLTDGPNFLMDADLVEASAQISANWFPGDDTAWQGTPYQTADARHREFDAARLCAEYFAGQDDCTEVESVDAIDDNEE